MAARDAHIPPSFLPMCTTGGSNALHMGDMDGVPDSALAVEGLLGVNGRSLSVCLSNKVKRSKSVLKNNVLVLLRRKGALAVLITASKCNKLVV